MFHRILIFAAALALVVGCGNSKPPQQLRPTGLRIVAGDRQVSQIVTPTGGVAVVTNPVPGVDVLSDTLVTQVIGDTISASMSPITGPSLTMSPRGPLAITIPAGTSVSYDVAIPGCGASFLSSATPDSSGQARTLWEIPGSRDGLTGVLPTSRVGWHVVRGDSLWSAECHMLAHLKTASGFVADTPFTAYFTPGPAAAIRAPARQIYQIGEDDPLLVGAGTSVTDVLGNTLPAEWLAWDRPAAFAPDTEVWDTATATLDGASGATELLAVKRIGAGWTFTARCDSAPSTMHGRVDSLTLAGTVDSVVAGWKITYAGYPVRYALWMSDYTEVWSTAGNVRVITHDPGAWIGIFQRPGALLTDVLGSIDTLTATGNLPTAFEREPGTISRAGTETCGGGAIREMALRAPGG